MIIRKVCFSILGLILFTVTNLTAQDYNERFRPQYHFTPELNWMNDPNGLVYQEGEYHLFYQHNPFGNTWGHMSWGHAVSRDLVHWQHLPVALEEENGIMIFSGSAVIDEHNTSGFGSRKNPPMIAIYTGHHVESELQDQRIAYSLDSGRTWTKYKGNPVIEGMTDFRDPKVFWHEESGRWVMVVALSKENKIRFYGSENLKKWELLSEFGPAGTYGGLLWECPDLFELPVQGEPGQSKWVLQVDVNPGAIAGGSGGQYFVGEFNGKRFEQDPQTVGQTLWADYGRDFYAVQSYGNIPEEDGRRIWIAWMNNWDYAERIPTSPWRSAMTVPREVKLEATEDGYRLVQRPVEELRQLRAQHIRLEKRMITPGDPVLPEFKGNVYELAVEFERFEAGQFGLKIRKGDNEATVIAYDTKHKELFVDRTRSGEVAFDSTFASVSGAPLPAAEKRIRFQVLVDRSSVEVFADGGRITITDRIFPSPSSDGIELFSEGGNTRLVSLKIWRLESAWKLLK